MTGEPTVFFDDDLEQWVIDYMYRSQSQAIPLTKDLAREIVGKCFGYTYLDAMNDLADVQLIDNTIAEAEVARAELTKLIKALCGV